MVAAAEVAAASSSLPLQMYYQCSADKLHLNKYQMILFTSAVMSILIQNAWVTFGQLPKTVPHSHVITESKCHWSSTIQHLHKSITLAAPRFSFLKCSNRLTNWSSDDSIWTYKWLSKFMQFLNIMYLLNQFESKACSLSLSLSLSLSVCVCVCLSLSPSLALLPTPLYKVHEHVLHKFLSTDLLLSLFLRTTSSFSL